MNAMPTFVSVREVGPRDGLQSIQRVVPTEVKCEWLRQAHAAGLREIEVGSFVPPRLLPQMADTADVVAFALTLAGLQVSVLVPNLNGAQRALEAGAHRLVLPISASVAHSLANVRRSPDDMIVELERICRARDASGSPFVVEAGIGTAFGCGLQGPVPPQEVLRLLQAALDAGADFVSLADTIGYADPAAVRTLFPAARAIAGDHLGCAHFHDTRGLGLANVLAALDCGVTRFDASLAGIGGCPFAPGASGNTATEDLIYMLHSMGCSTGVDLERLLALRHYLEAPLEGEILRGTIAQAGLPNGFQHNYSAAAAFIE